MAVGHCLSIFIYPIISFHLIPSSLVTSFKTTMLLRHHFTTPLLSHPISILPLQSFHLFLPTFHTPSHGPPHGTPDPTSPHRHLGPLDLDSPGHRRGQADHVQSWMRFLEGGQRSFRHCTGKKKLLFILLLVPPILPLLLILCSSFLPSLLPRPFLLFALVRNLFIWLLLSSSFSLALPPLLIYFISELPFTVKHM